MQSHRQKMRVLESLCVWPGRICRDLKLRPVWQRAQDEWRSRAGWSNNSRTFIVQDKIKKKKCSKKPAYGIGPQADGDFKHKHKEFLWAVHVISESSELSGESILFKCLGSLRFYFVCFIHQGCIKLIKIDRLHCYKKSLVQLNNFLLNFLFIKDSKNENI